MRAPGVQQLHHGDGGKGAGLLPVIHISSAAAMRLEAKKDDLIYISDRRRWLGGLRATQAIIEKIDETLEGEKIALGPRLHTQLVKGREQELLRVQRLY